MLVLGVSCYYHDSAIALVDDSEIKFAIHQERLSRHKHDARFPVLALGAVSQACGIDTVDLDRIVFYEEPRTKLARLWDQVIDDWPRSRRLFADDIPRFVRYKLPFANLLRNDFGYHGEIEFSQHHRSHAASAFFTSPFERALVVTLDGVGEYETAAVFLGEGNRLSKLRSIHFPHSLGLFYSVFTQYLGFEVNEGEYKVMGLAPYGKPRHLDKLLGPILKLSDDGSFALDRRFFDFTSRERHYAPRLTAHLGIAPRRPSDPVTEQHHDLAASVQQALELAIANMLRRLIAEHGITDFCFAGGVALNCTANARMIRELGIRSYIQPAAGDAGGALGAALQSIMKPRENEPTKRYAMPAYLGVGHPDAVIRTTLDINNIPYRQSNEIAEDLAERLAAGQVVAILHGRDEWGPRALGARSILADPRRADMKDHLNAKIKFREEFRPFAPVVKQEAYGAWFETLGMAESPYMLYTHQALQPDQTAAVTHVDGTSRVQTVSAAQNPYLYAILDAFERRTGVPVLINTSFNLRGEPIVSSPSDALKTFYASGIDCLALESFLIEKTPDVKTETGVSPPLKTVHLLTRGDTLKALYLDWETKSTRPDLVFILGDGQIVFQTNEVGLKGEALDDRRKLVVVWGDSVVFGAWRGWAHLLDDYAPGYQFINGGIDGDLYDNILRRARLLNRQRPVTLNVLMPGWHPFDPGPLAPPAPPSGGWWRRAAELSPSAKFRADLSAFLADVPNTVLLTMPTALNAAIADSDLSGYFTKGDDATAFSFIGHVPYSVPLQRRHLDFIIERNAIVKEVGAAKGVPVIDLFTAFDTTGFDDFRRDFADILHLRMRAYPRLAEIVYGGIKDVLGV